MIDQVAYVNTRFQLVSKSATSKCLN